MTAKRKQNVLRKLSALLSSLGSMANCNFFSICNENMDC